jgi:hypothetical protein
MSFFADYPASTVEPDTLDPDEVITALVKTMAEVSCNEDAAIRQNMSW